MKPIDVALQLAARGWPVLPLCWPDKKGKCGCGRNHKTKEIGKAPLTEHAWYDATTEIEIIKAWWKFWPKANVGLRLDTAGLFAIDVDTPEANTEAHQLGLPTTLLRISRQPAYIYRRPDDCPVDRKPNRGDSGKIDLLSGGYLVVYGRHLSGCSVYLEGNATELSPAPEWAVEALKNAARKMPYGPVGIPNEPPPADLNGLNLPDDLCDLVLTGGLDRFPSRSHALFSVETSLARLGFLDHEIASIVWSPGHAISAKPREQGLDWLAGDIARARVAAYCGDEKVRELVIAVSTWMDQQDWSGMSGATDWHVLLAHLAIVRKTGRAEYDAGTLSVSEEVGIDKDTVVASHPRLQDRGVLVRLSLRRRATKATTWTLNPPLDDDSLHPGLASCAPPLSISDSSPNSGKYSDLITSSYIPCVIYLPNQVTFHETWNWQGLGKTALRLWAILLSRPNWQLSQLAVQLNAGQRQVRKTLMRLAEHGLAETVAKTHWKGCRVDPGRMDEIASSLGVAGFRKCQQDIHQVHKEGYLEHVRYLKSRRIRWTPSVGQDWGIIK